MPEHLEDVLLSIVEKHARALESGALVVVDEASSRVRILPLRG